MHLPKFRLLAPIACLAASMLAAHAQTKPSGLPPAIQAQMDAANARFTSAQADIRQEIFTKVVHDTETQTGQIYFLRKAGSTQMGMKLLPPDAAPGASPVQVIEFKDGKLQLLTTGDNQIAVFDASKNRALAESLMTLGFGGSGTDLQKSWIVADQGSETLSGVKTEKLDLVSRDAGIKNNYSHITIWLDPVRDVSLKQTLFIASGGTPTGDTRTVFYTNIRLNQKVDETLFALKCKGKCTIVVR